jgi:hypothetical protein
LVILLKNHQKMDFFESLLEGDDTHQQEPEATQALAEFMDSLIDPVAQKPVAEKKQKAKPQTKLALKIPAKPKQPVKQTDPRTAVKRPNTGTDLQPVTKKPTADETLHPIAQKPPSGGNRNRQPRLTLKIPYPDKKESDQCDHLTTVPVTTVNIYMCCGSDIVRVSEESK